MLDIHGLVSADQHVIIFEILHPVKGDEVFAKEHTVAFNHCDCLGTKVQSDMLI